MGGGVIPWDLNIGRSLGQYFSKATLLFYESSFTFGADFVLKFRISATGGPLITRPLIARISL